MTVAARIEIGTGGSPEPGQSQPGARAPGKAPSAGWTGAVAESLSSSVPGAQSFRSSWQSMLASFGAGIKGSGEEEAGVEGNPAAAEGLLAETAGSASATSSSSAGAPCCAFGGGRDDLLSFELPGWNFCFSRSIGSAPASRCQSGSEEPGKRPAGSVCQQYAYSQYRQERKNGSRLQRNGAGGDAPARFSNSAGRGRPAATILSCGD